MLYSSLSLFNKNYFLSKTRFSFNYVIVFLYDAIAKRYNNEINVGCVGYIVENK